LNKGDAVEIIGKVDEYEGNRQLIADKVILK
jgi:DNA/RNA endonuclease YhcR with UshA esterase domain